MALSATGAQPTGYEPAYQGQLQGGSSMAAVAQLFARLSQEVEEHKPKNCIHFIVDFLCKHYPEHLHGFASIWQMDPDLERERHEVVNFFKAHKISTAVAAHFTNAGYDTLDTLTTLTPDSLVDVEAFNNVKWLPGHKVRLQQIFGEISARVRAYRQQFGEQQSHNHHHRRHGHHGHHSPPRHRDDSPSPVRRPVAKALPVSHVSPSYASATHASHVPALAAHPTTIYGPSSLGAHVLGGHALGGHALSVSPLAAPGLGSMAPPSLLPPSLAAHSLAAHAMSSAGGGLHGAQPGASAFYQSVYG